MEYCITVLLEEFLPGPRLRPLQPTRTTWGDAWRHGEQGSYAWQGDLYVRELRALDFLLPYLPQNLRHRRPVPDRAAGARRVLHVQRGLIGSAIPEGDYRLGIEAEH